MFRKQYRTILEDMWKILLVATNHLIIYSRKILTPVRSGYDNLKNYVKFDPLKKVLWNKFIKKMSSKVFSCKFQNHYCQIVAKRLHVFDFEVTMRGNISYTHARECGWLNLRFAEQKNTFTEY